MIVYESQDDLTRLINGFANRTLPCHEWTHQAHLIVGLWYCSHHDATTATDILRNCIKQYNIACGKQNTENSGYHETITLFWVRIIRSYLSKATLECSLVHLVNDLVTRYSDGKFPFEYYSRDRLMSWEAKTNWIEPDLKPLP